MYSEMSSLFPVMGSTIMWGESLAIEAKYHYQNKTGSRGAYVVMKTISYINAHTLLLKAVFDNAMYPYMFLEYLSSFFPGISEKWYYRVIAAIILFIIIDIINMYGLEIVGSSQILLGVFVLAPVVIFCVMSL